jgi:hypothetical protein
MIINRLVHRFGTVRVSFSGDQSVPSSGVTVLKVTVCVSGSYDDRGRIAWLFVVTSLRRRRWMD